MKERSPWVSRAVVAVLVLAGLAVGVVTFVKDREPGKGRFFAEDAIAVVTADGNLEIRSGTTGETTKVVQEGLRVRKDRPVYVTATPDGRYAYHDALLIHCGGRLIQAISSVDLVRGETQLAAVGAVPVLSADGKRLTYSAPSYDQRRRFGRMTRGRAACGSGVDVSEPPQGALEVTREVTSGEERVRSPRSPGQGVFPAELRVRCEAKSAPLPPKLQVAFGDPCEFSLRSSSRRVATLRGLGASLRFVDFDGGRLLAGWVTEEKRLLLGYTVGAKRAKVLADDVVAAAWLG